MSKKMLREIMQEISRIEAELDKWETYNNKSLAAELSRRLEALYAELPDEG